MSFFYNFVHKLKHSGKIKDSKKLFIDSTTVVNLQGVQGVSIIPSNPKHRGSKIHLIATANRIPIGVSFSDAKTHDLQRVRETIENIPISTKGATIRGDKGYVSNPMKETLKREKKIRFLAIPKRNMRQPSPLEKIRFKERITIENTIANLKRFDRVNRRRDKQMESFKAFTFIALICCLV